jgi:hypothetical protein
MRGHFSQGELQKALDSWGSVGELQVQRHPDGSFDLTQRRTVKLADLPADVAAAAALIAAHTKSVSVIVKSKLTATGDVQADRIELLVFPTKGVAL